MKRATIKRVYQEMGVEAALKYGLSGIYRMKSDEAYKRSYAALTTSSLGTSLLPSDTATSYLRKIVDSTTIIREASVREIRGDKIVIDSIAGSGRVTTKPTEGTAPTTGDASFTFARREISPTEIIAWKDLSWSFIEDNIEADQIVDTITDIIAAQQGLDLEELLIYGLASTITAESWAVTSAGAASSTELAHLKILGSGIIKLASNVKNYAGAVSSSTNPVQTAFEEAIDLIPTATMNRYPREAWRFYVHDTVEREYRKEIASRSTVTADMYLLENRRATFDGIPVVSCPSIKKGSRRISNAVVTDNTDIILAVPANFVTAYKRRVQFSAEEKPRSRTVELTFSARTGQNVERNDAYAVVRDVKFA